MKIVTKRIKVIQMTEEEIRKFHELMERAVSGHTSHYAEEKLADGSYLGVAVVPKEEVEPTYAKASKPLSAYPRNVD